MLIGLTQQKTHLFNYAPHPVGVDAHIDPQTGISITNRLRRIRTDFLVIRIRPGRTKIIRFYCGPMRASAPTEAFVNQVKHNILYLISHILYLK